MGLKIKDLPVANYMTPFPITVNPDVPFEEAIDFMAQRGIGNLIVSRGTFPEGILTEREIIQAVVLSKETSKLQVKDLGSQPFVKITPDTSVLEAANTMITGKSRLLVFADDDKLVGIITASDMLRAFRKTDDAPSIEKVVSSKVHKCRYTDTILDAVKILHDKRIGSIIIDNMEGYGIFTERDLLVFVLASEVDLNGHVGGYASSPLVVANQGIKANKAASIMAANNIKRLGLIKDGVLVGIVTARDLVDAYQSTYQISNPYLEQVQASMTKSCLDDNCYNLTKQLAKKLEFLSHASGYIQDANKCDSDGSERVWKTIIADEEKHAELLRNQLAQELQKISIPN